MEVIAHKFIILGSYSANTLGQIRSRGEKGIKIIAPVMAATRQTREKRDPQTHAVILDQQGQAITEEIEVKSSPLPGRFRLRYQPDGWEAPAYSGE